MAAKAAAMRHTCFSSSMTQLVLMSVVVFACPGMFNALSSIGLGGDPDMGRIVLCCLYGTWMVTSSFAPAVVNILGAKWAMFFGTFGYPIYSLAMFYHQRAWAVVAGCLLGISAGLLWTAQGQLMMSYPDRRSTARFVAIFWGIFNSGGVLGCLMSFFINIKYDEEGGHSAGGSSLSPATYWMFFSVMCAGAFLSLLILPLSKVTRRTPEGSVEPVLAEHSAGAAAGAESTAALVWREFKRTSRSFTHPTMLLLIPFMFYSNFFYEYHFGMIGVLFNGRTGSLTAALYWMAQIVGSFVLQAFLDWDRLSLGRRMRLSWSLIMVYIAATWAFGGYIQYSYNVTDEKQGLDLSSDIRNPLPGMLCICLWGVVDSFVQVWSYWMMSQLSREPEELACFTAFYKLFQNAGAFASFLLGLSKIYVLSYWVNVALIAATVPSTLLAMHQATRLEDRAAKISDSDGDCNHCGADSSSNLEDTDDSAETSEGADSDNAAAHRA